MYLKQPFWLSLTALARLNSKWVFVFLVLFLLWKHLYLHSKLPVCPSTLCLSNDRNVYFSSKQVSFLVLHTSVSQMCNIIGLQTPCWLTFKANLEINIWPRNKYLEAGKTELFKTELSTRKQFVELYTAFPHKSSEIYWPLYHRWNLVLNFEGSGSQCLRISPLVDIYNTIMHMKSEPVHIQCIYSLPILQILSLEVI